MRRPAGQVTQRGVEEALLNFTMMNREKRVALGRQAGDALCITHAPAQVARDYRGALLRPMGMRNSLARRVLWVHVILLLCGVLLRIFVIGQGEQYRQTAAAQSRYTLSAGTARGNIYGAGCAHW